MNNNEKSVLKGHSSSIKYEESKDTYFNKNVIRYKMRGIKSKKQKKVIKDLFIRF